MLTSVVVHFSSAPSPKAKTHQLRQCKLVYDKAENGHRYGRHKVAYILELHSTFNLMFIEQIHYKSTKESILGTSSREVGKQGCSKGGWWRKVLANLFRWHHLQNISC